LRMVRRSEGRSCDADAAVFLGDSMGELPMFFSAADVAFVGGSLVPHGGHNLLEPAALGVPVVTGPHLFNFAVVADLLLAADAARCVNSAVELALVVSEWLQNARLRTRIGENGRQTVAQNRGALDHLLNIVLELQENRTVNAGFSSDSAPSSPLSLPEILNP
jgi:3-deoxy-D-manno-octulosonic-acid transferase